MPSPDPMMTSPNRSAIASSSRTSRRARSAPSRPGYHTRRALAHAKPAVSSPTGWLVASAMCAHEFTAAMAS